MAGSLNKACLVGHVGQDPEIRRLPDGKPVANFSIATTDTWRDKNSGERKEHTEWHRIVVFGMGDSGGLATTVEKYVKKGSKLYIEGQLRTRSWEGQDGVKKYSTEIHLSGFGSVLLLLDRAERAPQATDTPGRDGERVGYDDAPRAGGEQRPLGRSMREEMDDEIPF